MSESNAHVDLSSLAIDDDDDFLPTLAVGGRAAEPPVPAYMAKIKATYDALAAAKPGERVKPGRIMVPVEPKEVSIRESKRKAKDGTEITTKYQQHPNITGLINRLRKAAEAVGLGVRIVVDYEEKNGVNRFRVVKGENGAPDTVRVRFVGQKRKQRKSGDAAA